MTDDMQKETVLLEAKNLKTHFPVRRWGFLPAGHVRALDGVSFSLRRGESVAIVGESGCGKSTLARTMLALHSPTAGTIEFEGRDMQEFDGADMRWYRGRVGYVQQDPYGALPPFMNVRRILKEPLIVNGITDAQEQEERIRRGLEEVRLMPVEDYLPKFPHMLSGGQQQRLVIARAIILGPNLLIADEPVSMLDASVRVEILKLLQKIQDDLNLTVCYITHDLSTVRYFSHRIFVMYAGEFIEKSTVRELLDHPAHPYTRSLLRAIPDPAAENARTRRPVPHGEPPSLMNPPAGCRFHPRCEHAIEGLCEQESPPCFRPDEGHEVACWLYED